MFKFLKDFLFEEEASMPGEVIGQVPQPPVDEIAEQVGGGGAEPAVLNMNFPAEAGAGETTEEAPVAGEASGTEAPVAEAPFWNKDKEAPVVEGDTATPVKVLDLTERPDFQDHVNRPDATPEVAPIILDSAPEPMTVGVETEPVMEMEHTPVEQPAPMAEVTHINLETLASLAKEAKEKMMEVEKSIEQQTIIRDGATTKLKADTDERARLVGYLAHLEEMSRTLQEIQDKQAALKEEEAELVANATKELEQINKAEAGDQSMAA